MEATINLVAWIVRLFFAELDVNGKRAYADAVANTCCPEAAIGCGRGSNKFCDFHRNIVNANRDMAADLNRGESIPVCTPDPMGMYIFRWGWDVEWSSMQLEGMAEQSHTRRVQEVLDELEARAKTANGKVNGQRKPPSSKQMYWIRVNMAKHRALYTDDEITKIALNLLLGDMDVISKTVSKMTRRIADSVKS